MALHFRPMVYAAMAGLVISGIYNILTNPGHSVMVSRAARHQAAAGAARVRRGASGDEAATIRGGRGMMTRAAISGLIDRG